jgi:arylformamidase
MPDDRSHLDWIDVTLPVTPALPVWPGDPPVRIERVSDVAAGDEATVSVLALGSHTGTHLDAPRHFLSDGLPVDRAPLDVLVGPARVLAVPGVRRVEPAHLAAAGIAAGERLLLRTRNSDGPWWEAPFADDVCGLSAAAARWLAERRVRLVGIDAFSVSAFADDAAGVHVPLLTAGVWVLEGLDLTAVPAGPCELLALPLRLAGGDGAPVRALVRPLGPGETPGRAPTPPAAP